MKEFLFGLGYLIVVIIVLRLIGRLLVRFLFEPLIRSCERRGYSTNPIPLAIWTALLGYEYTSQVAYSALFQQWDRIRWLTPEIYSWVVFLLLFVPYVILLIKTRIIYFIPVLLSKLLIFPAALLAMLCGYEIRSEKTPMNVGGYDMPSTGGGYAPTGGGYQGGYQSDGGQGDAPAGMPDFMADKYGDQYRESQGGDGYSITEVGGQTAYYKGDYAPFGSDGEHREYDSDYSPMD